ncbi:hypothetical protein Glove_26g278 [Diversispora epigaea]|uniref:DUF4371 domain-containing protein n=1 Tax=Diversispora epigaea TaxID=1348612 RepID=A0A397JQ14_9GLOM|nr:hypothetical protein Glove_26g278 [Diversispora epigaea]
MSSRKRKFKAVSVHSKCKKYNADFKKQVIEDLLEIFVITDIPLEKYYQSLKLLFDSKPVAIIIDETTDDCARSVVNTIFTYQNKTKLVFVDFFERVNNATMGQTFMTILTHFNISFNLLNCFFQILLPI